MTTLLLILALLLGPIVDTPAALAESGVGWIVAGEPR